MFNMSNIISSILHSSFGMNIAYFCFVLLALFLIFARTRKTLRDVEKSHRRIQVKPLDEVLEREYYTKLADYLVETGESRRDIPTYITTKLYDPNNEFYDAKGNRIVFDPDEVEDAFGDDPSYKWFSEFCNIRHTGWKQKPSIRVQRRLELISMARQTEIDED